MSSDLDNDPELEKHARLQYRVGTLGFHLSRPTTEWAFSIVKRDARDELALAGLKGPTKAARRKAARAAATVLGPVSLDEIERWCEERADCPPIDRYLEGFEDVDVGPLIERFIRPRLV